VCGGKRRIPEDEVATKEIQEERVRQLNQKEIAEGDYVLYWMQEAQRAEYNHALEYAVQRANELGQPLLVIFGLMTGYPEANLRHYAFLLEGLQDVKDALEERKIRGYLAPGRAAHGAPDPSGRRRIKPNSRMAKMAAKLHRAGRRARYRLRKQTVEPVLGQIKQARGFRQFLLRGFVKVEAEWALVCTAHNLTKLCRA
jgi:hypothetical protein